MQESGVPPKSTSLSQLARNPSLDSAPPMKEQFFLSLVGCSRRGVACCKSQLFGSGLWVWIRALVGADGFER